MLSRTPTQQDAHGSLRSWRETIAAGYRRLFVQQWSPYLGAVLLVAVGAALMLGGLFWGVFGGLKLWGDYLNQFLGLGAALNIADDLPSPLLHRISLMNITLLLGALAAALLSGQFRINRPPPMEYLWGALGGCLMGVGATLAGGCTIGGFFTPMSFFSAAGWAMCGGLMVGAFIGLKLLLWTIEHTGGGASPPAGVPSVKLRRFYPLFGSIILVGILLWALSWHLSDSKQLVSRTNIILAGFALGFILHRSRFCFARVFREPFMTGDATLTKALIVAFALGIPLFSFLLQNNSVDPYLAIPASFWPGSLAGGALFGVGMVFAGGCGSGSLWRAGEGHLKLMLAVLFFAWGGSLASAALKHWGVLTPHLDLDFLDGMAEITMLGYQAFLPDLLGSWSVVYVLSYGLLLAWYVLVRYNERSNRFTMM